MSTQRLKAQPKPEPIEMRYASAVFEWLVTGAKSKEGEYIDLGDGLILEVTHGNLPSTGTFATIKTPEAVDPIDLLDRLAATPLQNRNDLTVTFVAHMDRMLRLVPVHKIHPCQYMMNHLIARFLRWYGPGNHSTYSREVFIENMYSNLTEEEHKQMIFLLEAEFREPVQPSDS